MIAQGQIVGTMLTNRDELPLAASTSPMITRHRKGFDSNGFVVCARRTSIREGGGALTAPPPAPAMKFVGNLPLGEYRRTRRTDEPAVTPDSES